MRDLHKVQEQKGVTLMMSQVYALLGLIVVALGLAFILGYYFGRNAPAQIAVASDPLIPPDVQNESVALLLARVAEEEVQAGNEENVELDFHDFLPTRTGDLGEAPPRKARKNSNTRAKEKDSVKEDSVKENAVKEKEKPSPIESEDALEALVKEASGDDSKEPESSATAKLPGESGGAEEQTGSNAKSGASTKAAKLDNMKSSAKSSSEEKKNSEKKGSSAARSTTGKGRAATSARESTGKATRSRAQAARSSSKLYTVQVSSHQEPEVAEKLVRQLVAQGFEAYKVAAEVNGNTWYRVRVGSFQKRDGAEAELLRLKAARSELNPMITHR